MNGFKNTLIFILSVVVLAQSVFLVYFIRRAKSVPRKVEALQVKATAKKPAAREIIVPIQPPKAMPAKPPLRAPEPLSGVAVPVPVPASAKISGRIVIVLDDWGYSLRNKGFITDNDFHVTLSVLPGKPYSGAVARFASEKGKDVIVHMPMEPHDKKLYGLEERTLLVGMEKKEILDFLDEAFLSVPNAKGLSNHMGSLATENSRFMAAVMEYLKKKDMIFFDSLVSQKTVGRALAKKYGVKSASRDVFLDNENDPVYIRGQMLKLADRAKKTGLAFGVGHDRPYTIAVLQEMIPRLEKEGYRFVNLSEVTS